MTIKESIQAIFENGVFRPISPLEISIPEGYQVQLTVEMEKTSEDVLALATKVYEGLSEKQIDEIEEIILNRRNFASELSLEEMLAEVNQENIHNETDTGPAVGKEIW